MDHQIKRDAEEFGAAYVPFKRQEQHVGDYVAAYLAGATQLKQYVEQFVLRIEKTIGSNGSEWERGQLDGMRWVGDQLRTLFGED
jgi:hypothetical protein